MWNSTRVWRRRSPGEAGHGKIEAAPKKVRRAAFATKARPKFFEHAISVNHSAPEAVGILRIVRAMFLVLVECDRVFDLVRDHVDLHPQLQLIQRSHHRFVEIRDAARLELDDALTAIAF